MAQARAGSLFVLPSVAEAFGVAYVEAMAAGVPAIGCRGEDGPEEIAAAGGGIELVAPRDPRALAAAIDALLRDPGTASGTGPRRPARRSRGSSPGSAAGARRSPPTRRCSVADAVASEPYDPDNLLDRLSRAIHARAPLPPHEARERRSSTGGSDCAGGDVLSVGCGWHPGRHLFPAPDFRLVAVDADPARVLGVLETGRADEAHVGYAGQLGAAAASFDVVLYRLVLHHIAFQGPLAPCFTEAARLLRPGGALIAIEPGLLASGRRRARRSPTARGWPPGCTGRPMTSRCRRGGWLTRRVHAGLQPELHAVTYAWRRLTPGVQQALAPLDGLGSRPARGAVRAHPDADRQGGLGLDFRTFRTESAVASLRPRVDSRRGAGARRAG